MKIMTDEQMKYILSVEDTKFFSATIKKSIEKSLDNITVMTAASMKEAKKILDSGKYYFEIALLDMNLPDAPNGEIVDLVMKHKVPIFVFSSMMEDKLHKQVFSKAVVDYVLKNNTSSISSLVKMIKRYLKNATTKILYVDDSKTAQRFISNLLKRYNFDVLTATSGPEALGVLKENPDLSLVLTDFIMPKMDGVELTKEIRKTYPDWNIAIIGLSSDGNDNLSSRFLKSGGNDFINKNFHREEFFCRIHQNINLVEQINQLHSLAANDFLTGLPNKRTFFTMGETLQENAVHQAMSTIVAVMEIDNFKDINDAWGHKIADNVLKTIATALAKKCRSSDLIARMVGEKFAFIGIDVNVKHAFEILNDFRKTVENLKIQEGGKKIKVTMSAGFANLDFSHNFGENLDNMVKYAEEALDIAKENGQNKVEQYNC